MRHRLGPSPDRGGTRRCALHAGVLVPWANSVVEAELPRWAGNSVVWHYARLVPSSRATALDEKFLAGLLGAAPAALRELAALRLCRVYLACTSAAFMLPGKVASAIEGSPVPVITAFDAITALLRQRGVDRIVLLTPYPERICEAEAEMFSACGIVVTGRASLDLEDGYAVISTGQIRALARQVGARPIEEAQAIVLSCTGWPTFGLAARLQRQFGRDVISSNLAIAMHAQQLSEGET